MFYPQTHIEIKIISLSKTQGKNFRCNYSFKFFNISNFFFIYFDARITYNLKRKIIISYLDWLERYTSTPINR
jgi:hypothetical protein